MTKSPEIYEGDDSPTYILELEPQRFAVLHSSCMLKKLNEAGR